LRPSSVVRINSPGFLPNVEANGGGGGMAMYGSSLSTTCTPGGGSKANASSGKAGFKRGSTNSAVIRRSVGGDASIIVRASRFVGNSIRRNTDVSRKIQYTKSPSSRRTRTRRHPASSI
jgi:hypothetical protein